jgi:transposase
MYREVKMEEVKEVVLLWLLRIGKKRIAAQLGLDAKTVRRYVRAAHKVGLRAAEDPGRLSEEALGAILKEIRPAPVRERGEAWAKCEQHRAKIETWLKDSVGLTKCQRLLTRQGVELPYGTLYRFAVRELGFGAKAATLPVADGEPGKELDVDTGWMTLLEPDERGVRRRFKAFIFTPNVSRYRFVYPVWRERTEDAIKACEAAWEFYGGVFEVLIPDNTKAIVQRADPLEPLIQRRFLEYAQARGFHIDPTRARKPRDKARVEKSVRDSREDCFRGEHLHHLEQARQRGLYWSRSEYGMRRHEWRAAEPTRGGDSAAAGRNADGCRSWTPGKPIATRTHGWHWGTYEQWHRAGPRAQSRPPDRRRAVLERLADAPPALVPQPRRASSLCPCCLCLGVPKPRAW